MVEARGPREQFVLNSISDIVFELDRDGKVTYISSAVGSYGYKPAELLGRELIDFIHPDDRHKAFRRILERRTGSRRTEKFEVRLFDNRGNTVNVESKVVRPRSGHFELTSEGMYDTELPCSAAFLGTRGVIRDISQRKIAEKKSRLANECFQAYLQNALDPVYLLEGDRYVEANKSALQAFGYARHELIGETPYGKLSPFKQPDGKLSSEKAFSKITAAMAGEPQQFDWRHRRADGSEFDVEVRLNRIMEYENARILVVFRDITEEREETRQLKTSEKRLRNLAESFSEGLLILEHGRLVFANSSALQIFGRSSASKIDRMELRSLVQDYDSPGDAKPRWIERQDGSKRYVRARCNDLRRHSDGTVSTFVILSDFTEEQMLRDQVVESQKMEAVGALAGGVAHDMNNILTAIHGYAELLDTTGSGVDREEITGYSREIQSAADRASLLVKQILSFSRRSDGIKVPIAIRSLVEEACTLLLATLPPRIEIRRHFSVGNVSVLGDPTRFHQVVMNLCTNAAQAIGTSDGVIDISLRISKASEHMVELRVEDDGIGMAEKTIKQIFAPFFTTKAKGEGTGLGLSVVYGIVKEMEGDITVKSVPDEGSTFTVCLPVCPAANQEDAGEKQDVPLGAGRIVLVDDEKSLVRLGAFMIRKLGYEVQAFSDSKEALDSMIQDPNGFDLLITDQLMPRLGGDELISKIREHRPELPVVVVTGFGEQNSDNGNGVAEFRYLAKPYSVKELSTTIADCIDAGREIDG